LTAPGLRVIELAGSPSELGLTHGEELRSVIADALRRWFGEIEARRGITGDAYITSFLAATGFIRTIETFTPALLEEVRGIAEGARQSFETIFAYQLMDEEWWYRTSLSRAGRAAIEACSAVGVMRKDGTSLVAQNMDLPSVYDGTQVLLHLRPAQGPEALVFGPAGMIGTTGLSRNGIGLCCNSIPQLRHSSSGLPVAFVFRGALARENFEDAVTFLQTVPHATGQNYLLGAPGAVKNLECSTGQVREVALAGAQVTHTNHPLANKDIDVEAARKERGSTTIERLERLRRDLSGLGDRVNIDDVKRTLSDGEVPVCVPRGSDWMTLGSLIMELSAEPVLHIAPGPPADTPYSTVGFS
jgi:isopenicillin-N N-acyltransferase like protein